MKKHKKLVRLYSETWLHFRTEKDLSVDNKLLIAVNLILLIV